MPLSINAIFSLNWDSMLALLPELALTWLGNVTEVAEEDGSGSVKCCWLGEGDSIDEGNDPEVSLGGIVLL